MYHIGTSTFPRASKAHKLASPECACHRQLLQRWGTYYVMQAYVCVLLYFSVTPADIGMPAHHSLLKSTHRHTFVCITRGCIVLASWPHLNAHIITNVCSDGVHQGCCCVVGQHLRQQACHEVHRAKGCRSAANGMTCTETAYN